MKLRAKFSLLISLLVVIIVAGVTITLLIAESRFLVKEAEQSRVNMIRSLAQVAKESAIVNDDILLLNYLKLVKNTPALTYAFVTDGSGRVLAHTDMSLLGTTLTDEQSARAARAADLLVQKYVPPSGDPVLDLALPVRAGETATAVARIGFSQAALAKSVNEALAVTRKRILMVAVAALVAGLLGAFILTQMMAGPIQKIAEGARIVGQGKLDHTIAVKSRDELGELAAEFNRMSAKLKELDQMKSDFVSSVTHELRSPLLSLKMYIDLFFKGTAGAVTDKQKEYLQVMKDCSTRLSRFIDDLLDMAKIERGKMEVVPQSMQLAPVAQEIEKLFRPQVDAKGITLGVSVPDSLPRVMADPERTRQVLINLLSNAVKFTPQGGTIKLDAVLAGRMVDISVTDTGIGIPADKLNAIFDKFEQVREVRDKIAGPKGTGLGLAIVKGILEAQGGKITVKSVLGKGSCFQFSLPLAEGK